MSVGLRFGFYTYSLYFWTKLRALAPQQFGCAEELDLSSGDAMWLQRRSARFGGNLNALLGGVSRITSFALAHVR